MAAVPIGLDQQRQHRIGDRLIRGKLDHLTPVGGVHGFHVHAAEELRPGKAVAREGVAGSELNLQVLHRLRRSIEQLDLRFERLIERRKETDVPEAESERR